MTIDTQPDAETVEWDWSRVVPGETIQIPAVEGDDDIAPGVLEVVPNRTPVVYRAGSAAMVVASKTGRVAGLSARHAGTFGLWFGAGAKAMAQLGYRYVRAHDLQEALGGVTKSSDWNKVEYVRKCRWKTLGWLTGGIAGFNLAGWWSLVAFGETPALDWSWIVTPGFTGLVTATITALYGRYRLNNPGIAAGQILHDDDVDDGEEPFPLAVCGSPGQVEECVSRALYAEGIGIRSIRFVAQHAWGKEIDVMLKGATPGKVAAAADQLDAHFNIKKGGTLIEPDMQQAAHITLRLVTSNPFASMPKPTVHAPNSLNITDAHNFGVCMDGSPFDLVLDGLRILAIGVSGAAKTTGVLRDLAEVITACHNAIAIEMDPVKDGLREFEDVMAVPSIRGVKDCEIWLGYLVKMATARNVVRNRLKMGDTWEPSAEHPDIFVFADEYIYLSQKGKELFIQLVRLGKQVGIYPIAAGQDATSDSLGDAIAETFTLKVMLAARHADIPIVLGQGAIAEGFRPDRLVPAQNKQSKNDAGQSYIKGAGLTRPLLYGWNEYSRDQIDRAVADRVAAGRPWFDDDTLREAGLLNLKEQYGPGSTAATGSSIVKDAAAVLLNAEVDRMRTEVLAEGLQVAHPDRYGELTVDTLKELLRSAGVDAPVQLGMLDGRANPRGYKIGMLIPA
jgi:S-DNA-T family DNA segregation ATPase FtsK/SpoIIIE